ncbi:MAG: PaaI family thioesterase [Geminicoccaceae bacterium]|nr:PaaI family thioesterase [Geminicoccaceae bacterium]
MTGDAFAALATRGVPYVGQLGCTVERFEHGRVDVRLPCRDLLLRPGGTICGPAMMALADITLYGVVLSMVGPVELAVTADFNIHFLRKPRPGDLIARGRCLKLGRSLVVGEVSIVPDRRADAPADPAATPPEPRPVAHVIATYALPPSAPTYDAPPSDALRPGHGTDGASGDRAT